MQIQYADANILTDGLLKSVGIDPEVEIFPDINATASEFKIFNAAEDHTFGGIWISIGY